MMKIKLVKNKQISKNLEHERKYFSINYKNCRSECFTIKNENPRNYVLNLVKNKIL